MLLDIHCLANPCAAVRTEQPHGLPAADGRPGHRRSPRTRPLEGVVVVFAIVEGKRRNF